MTCVGTKSDSTITRNCHKINFCQLFTITTKNISCLFDVYCSLIDLSYFFRLSRANK